VEVGFMAVADGFEGAFGSDCHETFAKESSWSITRLPMKVDAGWLDLELYGLLISLG